MRLCCGGHVVTTTLALLSMLLSVSHAILDDNIFEKEGEEEQHQQHRQLKNGLLNPKMKIRDFDPPMVGEDGVDGAGAGVFHRGLLSSTPSESPSSVPTSSRSKKSGKGKKKGKESDVPSSVPTIGPSLELPSSSISPSAAPSSDSSKKKKKKKPKKPKMPKKPKKGKESEVPSTMPSPTQTDVPSTAPSSMPVPQTDSSTEPSGSPSDTPSTTPASGVPSLSIQPSTSPETPQSSSGPSAGPSSQPSLSPSSQPSTMPSTVPSVEPSLVPSESSIPSAPPSPTTWCRRLTNFDDSQLYRHVEDPFLRDVSAEFLKKVHAPDVSMCNLRESLYFQQMVSIKDCFDPASRRRRQGDDVDDVHEFNHTSSYEPWIIPDLHSNNNNVSHGDDEDEDVAYKNNNMTVKLLAKNPGLWTIENFLTSDEVDRYIELMDKNGNGKGMYGSCNDPRKEYLTSQPSLNKVCFMIGVTKQCEGPYQVSTWEHDVDPDDGMFVRKIQQRATNIMTVASKEVIGLGPKLTADPYMRTAVALGGTPPQLLHDDTHDVVTFLIYLTDGGAKTIFPEPNVEIEPKGGMAVTWINVDTDGYELQRSFHAVQAHIGPDPRMITRVSFPRELNTWTKTVNTRKKTAPSAGDGVNSSESVSSPEGLPRPETKVE